VRRQDALAAVATVVPKRRHASVTSPSTGRSPPHTGRDGPAEYVDDFDELDASVHWLDTGSFAERVRRYLDDNGVQAVPE